MKMKDGTYKYVNSKWTDEIKQWMKDNIRGVEKYEAWELFHSVWGNTGISFNGFLEMRSRLKLSPFTRQSYSTKCRPLYSEQIKKGYVRIKVAMPNVWWSKAKWVYLETHPEELKNIQENDCFYFLDGNNRNFDPDNIFLVHRREQAIFQYFGGVVKDDPQQTKIHLLQARLKLTRLDKMQDIGQIKYFGNYRMTLDDYHKHCEDWKERSRIEYQKKKEARHES